MSDAYIRDDTGPPNVRNLTDRRQIILMLMAAGWRNVDIAREFGLQEGYISVMRTSPLFRAQIAEMQKQLRESTVHEVMEMIESEAANSVKLLVDVRDDSGDGKAADRNVQRQAANDLLDRHPRFAKKTQHEEVRVHRIVFDKADVERMMAAMPVKPAVIDVTPEEPK